MEYVILFIIVTIILVLLYGKYNPHIDIIKCFNTHIIILWYNKTEDNEVKRVYIKLFEYEDKVSLLTFVLTLLIIIIFYIIISIQITASYRMMHNKIDSLEYKIDSLQFSTVNYTTFENKTPEDGIDEALFYYGIKHPTIVKAQAILETGHFTSDLCIKNNNLFGLYDSKNKKYYSYNHWWESVKAYKELIQRKYDNSKYYYMFLEDIKYAEDKEYINKLKEIAEGLE